MSEKCYIWTRVSTRYQEDNGGSLSDQRQKCENYAKEHGYVICGYYGGTHESAQTPGFLIKKMISAVKRTKNINHIIVNQADRFSRNAGQAINIINDLCRCNVQVDEVCSGITTATPEGKMMLQIKLSMAEWDNVNRTNKFSSGIENCLRQGVYIGAKPLGYDKAGKSINTTYTINADGMLLKKAFNWKLKGMANYKIAEKLSIMGLPMSEKHLHKILVNPFYAGIIKHKRLHYEMIEGKHPAIVNYENFLRVQEILSGKTGKYVHQKETPQFPLKRHVRCAADGTPFTAYSVKKKHIDYYKCNKKGCKTNVAAKVMHNKYSELLDTFNIPAPLTSIVRKIVHDTINGDNTELKETLAILTKSKTELENKIKNNKLRFADGVIDEDIYQTALEENQAKLNKILHELEQVKSELSNSDSDVDSIVAMCCKLGTLWKESSLETCQKLQNLVFPDGILWDKKTGNYRTTKVNEALVLIRKISDAYKNIGEGNELSPVALCG